MLDQDYLEDLFAPFGPVTVRRMFGGQGVRFGDLMIALVAGGVVYLKADAETVPRFEAAGSAPFDYERKGKPVSLSFWRLPEEAVDDPDALREWAELALGAARRSAVKSPPRKPRKSRRIS